MFFVWYASFSGPHVVKKIVISVALLLSLVSAHAQKKASKATKDPKALYDSSFYISYDRHITARYYFSKKYTAFNLRNLQQGLVLKYFPNTTLNMGVGATYKWATLNLAYGFGFLNPDNGTGKTKYLDLQMHNYGRKIIVDVFGQFYNGFYLNDDQIKDASGEYYKRPDLKVRVFGVSGQYLFNFERFSYRAAFLNNEWQKRSAGSMLLGWEFFLGQSTSDSSMIPSQLRNTPGDLAPVGDLNINSVQFIETGPNVGYAYTYVYKKHFFLTGSLTVSLDYGKTIIEGDMRDQDESFSPNSFVRFFTGYNSEKWALSVSFVNQALQLSSRSASRYVSLNTGNVRVNAVYRFMPNRKTRKVLKVID